MLIQMAQCSKTLIIFFLNAIVSSLKCIWLGFTTPTKYITKDRKYMLVLLYMHEFTVEVCLRYEKVVRHES